MALLCSSLKPNQAEARETNPYSTSTSTALLKIPASITPSLPYLFAHELSIMDSDKASSPSTSSSPKAEYSVVFRNALRYSLSEKEYHTLHESLLRHCTPAIRRKLPSPQQYESLNQRRDDYNAAAVRASLRVFITTQSGLKLWSWISGLLRRGNPQTYVDRAKD